MKVAIIGGGASGLFLANLISNNDVTIYEAKESVGKKILATGNGRCNYWNDYQDLSCYESLNNNLIDNIINEDTAKFVLDKFASLGIVPKKKDGYYYPLNNKAKTIRDVLYNSIKDKVKIVCDKYIDNIIIKDDKFIIDDITYDKVVISTGSNASNLSVNNTFGYDYLNKNNIKVRKNLPALVSLLSNEDFLSKWDGIRSDAKVTLFINDECIKEEVGEIQLTKNGISGICVFNISNLATRALDENKKVSVHINFLPSISFIDKFLVEQTKLTNLPIYDLLSNLIDPEIVKIIENRCGLKNKLYTSFMYEEKRKLVKYVNDFDVNVIGSKDYLYAQVCSGGVYLDELNEYMELKKIKNMYVIGELLDLTGICGGYNLGIAFRSAYLASRGINND